MKSSLSLAQHGSDMNLLCWGSGELGQTGHGRPGDIGPEEAHLRAFTASGLGRVKLLACGSSHSVVITVDNKIFAWGNGTSGQLGDGDRTVKEQPVQVKLPQELNSVNIVGVACGSRHSFVWTENGQAYSFGNNFYAQLGYDFQRVDYKEHQLVPRLFQNLPSSLKISQVACGERHTLFALEDGGVAACGQNDYGQVGSGSNENAVVPRLVEFVDGHHHVSKVTCGANHNLALTGEGRLFQWGSGRACGKEKGNILVPEEVTFPSSPVRDIAAGCEHSLLLTDGGNVFSWGMGQEGQLGLGEDRIYVFAPSLLSNSQLTEVTQIRAGDSYSAAVTAGGELLLWGQIPCASRVTGHPGLKRLWTPQLVSLADGKVCDVACGTWHMMVLACKSWSGEKNRECAHPKNAGRLRDFVSNPLPTERTEKENRLQDSKQVPDSRLLQGLGGPDGSNQHEKDEESERAEEEKRHVERPNKDEGDGALRDSAFAIPRSAKRMDRRGNGHSSIKSNRGNAREDCRTAGPWEQRKEPYGGRGSRDVVFTTLHLLPRSEGARSRPTTSILPRLLTAQQTQSTVLAEAQKERSTYLTELVQKSASNRSISQCLQPQPRPPGTCTDPLTMRVTSSQSSITGIHTGHTSAIYNPFPSLSLCQQVQTSSSSSNPRPEVTPTLTPAATPTAPSESIRYCPTHGKVVSSFGASRKNL